MLQEQNSKSKERLRLEEQRDKYEQKLREQIKKDERRQREREKSLKLLIGELFTKNLPDYMLYEEAEMERIVAAAMGSDDCRAEIESIKAEAGNVVTGTSSDGTQKPSRLGTSKSDDVKSTADASVTENDDDSEDKDADVSVDTGNDASNDDDSEASEDSSDDDSSEDEYEEDFSDEESDEE